MIVHNFKIIRGEDDKIKFEYLEEFKQLLFIFKRNSDDKAVIKIRNLVESDLNYMIDALTKIRSEVFGPRMEE